MLCHLDRTTKALGLNCEQRREGREKGGEREAQDVTM